MLHAARRVLEAAGHRVAVAWPDLGSPALCCGRTYLATGQVDKAKARGAAAACRRCCPSSPRACRSSAWNRRACSRCATSSWRMGLGEDAQAVCDNAFLFEEFLAREKKAGRLELDAEAAAAEGGVPPRPLPPEGVRRHERGAGGAGAGARARREPRSNSSCCGMAGSFGYEAEHYDTSIAMAELSLMPAVRKAPADALIVADGTSCRHQIADGANRQAVHVAEVLAQRALALDAKHDTSHDESGQIAAPPPLWHGPRPMQQRPRNPYSSAEIDRASHERENDERMIELASSGAARFVPIDTEKNLVKSGGNPEAVFLQGMMARAVVNQADHPDLPGLCRGHALFRRRRHRQGRAAEGARRVRRPAPGRRAPVRARGLDPGLCPRHDLLAPPPPLLRRVRRHHQGDARRPCPQVHQRELQDRAFPAHRSGGDHAGPLRRQVPARPQPAFPARHAFDPGGLRRAGRELRGRRGARGLRGGEGAREERHLPLLAALAVPGLGDDRLPRRGRSRSTTT